MQDKGKVLQQEINMLLLKTVDDAELPEGLFNPIVKFKIILVGQSAAKDECVALQVHELVKGDLVVNAQFLEFFKTDGFIGPYPPVSAVVADIQQLGYLIHKRDMIG
jgi:hypothetical protein